MGSCVWVALVVPYWIGRGGGEIYLHRHVNHQKFDQLRQRFENKEFAAVLIPSMLPPPTPWKVFVFAAGVFEMPVRSFLLAVFLGRVIRWMTLAILVLELGPGAVSVVQHHARTLLAVLCLLLVLGAGWWWLQKRRGRKRVKGAEEE